MTIYYKPKTVTGTAQEETAATVVTSTEEEPKTVRAIWVTEVTSTLQHDATIKVYVERTLVLEMKITQLLDSNTSDTKTEYPRLPLDIELPVGEELVCGQVSGGTATDIEFVAEYTLR